MMLDLQARLPLLMLTLSMAVGCAPELSDEEDAAPRGEGDAAVEGEEARRGALGQDAEVPDGAPGEILSDAEVIDEGGARVHIHIRATAAPFEHDDDLASQTPLHHANGIRAFSMLRERGDEAPVLVFDHGDGYVEASYGDGDDTIVGDARVADLPEGHYTWGRVIISHVRYSVRATAHAQGVSMPGAFDNVQVLSDHTEIDGIVRDAGWYRFVYEAGGFSFPREGEGGAPVVPAWPTGAPIEAVVEDGQTALYFPINIVVDHRLERDVHQIMEFNVHESFRWADQDQPGYAEGVFDATPLSFEPVMRFGANAYTHYLDASIP